MDHLAISKHVAEEVPLLLEVCEVDSLIEIAAKNLFSDQVAGKVLIETVLLSTQDLLDLRALVLHLLLFFLSVLVIARQDQPVKKACASFQ